MKEEKSTELELFSSGNEQEINQVVTILKENSIPCIKKETGSGAYMTLYMGQSIQGKTIFVNQEDYEKALELIGPFTQNETEQEDTTIETNKYVWVRRGLGFLLLGVPIIAIVLVILVVYIKSKY